MPKDYFTMSRDEFNLDKSIEHRDPMSCFITNLFPNGSQPGPMFAPSMAHYTREHIIAIKGQQNV